MKDAKQTAVDFELKALDIATELTVAKLNRSSPSNSNSEVGKNIGKMFLAIHKEVSSAFKDLED